MYLQCTSLKNWKFEKELQKVTPIFLNKKKRKFRENSAFELNLVVLVLSTK